LENSSFGERSNLSAIALATQTTSHLLSRYRRQTLTRCNSPKPTRGQMARDGLSQQRHNSLLVNMVLVNTLDSCHQMTFGNTMTTALFALAAIRTFQDFRSKLFSEKLMAQIMSI
jgi:hypothetical protein